MRPFVLVLILAQVLGCAHVGAILSAASRGAQAVAAIVDVADAATRVYQDAHPSPENALRLDAALVDVRQALALYQRLLAEAHTSEAQIAEARAALLRAYGAYREALESVGVLGALPTTGGAQGEATPLPLDMPTVATVEGWL